MQVRFGLFDIGSKSQGKSDRLTVSVNAAPPASYPAHIENSSLFQGGDVSIAGHVRSMTITCQYAFLIGL
jgi:hypothetical protein